MIRSPLFASLAAAALLLAAAPAVAADPDVKVLEKPGVGSYLADASGRTLYYFRKDVAGKSSCVGPCTERWPAFHREVIVAPAGLNPDDFATIARPDGKKQTTYQGKPLYYFVGDRSAGDTSGHELNEAWYAVTP